MTQATLRDTLHFKGVGLHTGAQGAVAVQPAGSDEGLSFVSGETRIPATVEYVSDTSRATVLSRNGVSVSTTEHLLSALFAMGVTNAEIHVQGPEIPALDGSAIEFVDAILACGLQRQPLPRRLFELAEPFFIEAADRMIVALPSADFRVRFVADFAPPIGTQYFFGQDRAQGISRRDCGRAYLRLSARGRGVASARPGSRRQPGERAGLRARRSDAAAALAR